MKSTSKEIHHIKWKNKSTHSNNFTKFELKNTQIKRQTLLDLIKQ